MMAEPASVRAVIKSLIIRQRPVYEAIQRLRDYRFLKRSEAAGSYAQSGEDRVLLEMLVTRSAKGPYADIGCNHPFVYNNTFLLYTRGWRGICLDPLARFERLYRKWRPGDRFVGMGIGDEGADVPLFEFEWDMLSTLDPAVAQAYERAGHRLVRTRAIQVRSLDTVLRDTGFKPPLSVISLDVEGRELSALQSVDLAYWRPELICLEEQTAAGVIRHDATSYLEANSYRVAQRLGANVILARS